MIHWLVIILTITYLIHSLHLSNFPKVPIAFVTSILNSLVHSNAFGENNPTRVVITLNLSNVSKHLSSSPIFPIILTICINNVQSNNQKKKQFFRYYLYYNGWFQIGC